MTMRRLLRVVAIGLLVAATTVPLSADIIAQNHFKEQTYSSGIGTINWTPGAGQTEMGYSTVYTEKGGTPRTLGPYNSDPSPHRYRVRSAEATVTFASVDLSGFDQITAQINLSRRDTFEAPNYFRAILTYEGNSLDLARIEGTNLNSFPVDTWQTYTVSIPQSWNSAVLTVSALSDSSVGAELLEFDAIEFNGSPVPEPSTLALLVAAGLCGSVLVWRRRK